jgi:protein involved in polysaccharide export with SLBB domain
VKADRRAKMIAKLTRAGLYAAVFVAISLANLGSSFASDYKLGTQDKLRIKVYEWPALSDEVSVGDDGVISLPLIGNLTAAGISATELAQQLARKLQAREKLAVAPDVSVEVVQYRPFYILGHVQRPGEYPYRPGMTVLMALSISGGVYRADENLRLERDAILSKGSLFMLGAKKRELVARLARLKSELSGKNKIEFDPASLGDGGQVPELPLEEEGAIMLARRKSFDNQIASLRLHIAGYREEIGLLTARMESSLRQQRSAEKEAQALKVLGEKGLGVLPREATMERLAAQIQGDQREIDTLIARGRQNIGQAEGAIIKLADERDKELIVEVRQTSAQLEEVEEQLSTQRNLLNEAETLSGANQGMRAGQTEGVRFRISRRNSEGTTREVTAQKDDRVEPGDVVTVEKNFARIDLGVGPVSRPAAGSTAQAGIDMNAR